MQFILDFLSDNPALALCICLALGYLIGFIRIKGFTVGATIGTLVVGFVLSRFTSFSIPGLFTTVFSLLFCFTLGYEAGPAFFKSLKANGLKFILHATVFFGASLLVLYLLGLSGILDRDSVIGIAAGALTQTSILTVAEGLGDMASVSYALTYMTGTLLAILFASVIGPKLIRTSPIAAARQKLAKTKASASPMENDVRLAPVYPRAFAVDEGAVYIGHTVEELEDRFSHTLELVKCFRSGKEIPVTQELTIEAGDVITVISTVSQMIAFDDEYMREVSGNEYLSLKLVTKEIIITEEKSGSLVDIFSAHGVVLNSVITKNGKKLRINDTVSPERGMTVKVSGVEKSVEKIASVLGYVKEIGNSTDVPFVFGALAAAVIFGALKIGGFGLGDSTCALILGLVCGWYCNKNPRVGKFPESARWFLKSVGLNLFIAAKALGTGAFPFDSKVLLILGIGMAVTLIPHLITLLFCKFVLRMDDADNLGGLCGSGTCTAALNSLMDSSGSSVFTAAYATTNAVANILLTVLGVILSALL